MRLLNVFMLFFAVASFSLLTQSCQKSESSVDVNQDKIHQYLELFYNSKEDKTYAYAQFRFGNAAGTPLELGGSATIAVESNSMSWNANLNLNRYEWTWTGKKSAANFVYTDNDGNVFNNTVTIKEADFPTSLDTISKAASYDLTWVGNSLAANEEIWVLINENNELNGALFEQKVTNSTSITLTKNKLDKIDPSAITLWMDRSYKPAISQATSAGGILVGKYRAVKENVILTN